MKEAMWREKQIQTILSATHTVTTILLKGKMFWIECSFAQNTEKTYRLYFKGCIDVCGPNSDCLTCAEWFLFLPLNYWNCFSSAAHLNAFMSIKVIILAAEVVLADILLFEQLAERRVKMVRLVPATQKRC